jgi:hypothetical protein
MSRADSWVPLPAVLKFTLRPCSCSSEVMFERVTTWTSSLQILAM